MLDDRADLAAAGTALVLAQVFDLFGQMQHVDRQIAPLGPEGAQRRGLGLGPGVEIVLVEVGGETGPR